jgi:hypothetical protein
MNIIPQPSFKSTPMFFLTHWTNKDKFICNNNELSKVFLFSNPDGARCFPPAKPEIPLNPFQSGMPKHQNRDR